MSSDPMLVKKIKDWVLKFERKKLKLPIFIGLNGPQGIGKSTLCANLISEFKNENIKAIHISVDDFYLTRAEQEKVSKENANNPYLQMRGYPGTHDLKLGLKILQNLQSHKRGFKIPRYEKSINKGKGDRLPESDWITIESTIDIVFFEGWMLGFLPVANVEDPNLAQINENLKQYSIWHKFIDDYIILKPENFDSIQMWRIESEKQQKKLKKSGMKYSEVKAFIKKFIPAYKLYLEPFYKAQKPRKCLTITINHKHEMTSFLEE